MHLGIPGEKLPSMRHVTLACPLNSNPASHEYVAVSFVFKVGWLGTNEPFVICGIVQTKGKLKTTKLKLNEQKVKVMSQFEKSQCIFFLVKCFFY